MPCMEAHILQANLERDAFPTCVIAAAHELARCSCHGLQRSPHQQGHGWNVCMALHDSVLLAALTSLYPPYPVGANQVFRSVKQLCIRARRLCMHLCTCQSCGMPNRS